MRRVVIGSIAAQSHVPGFREPRDRDMISDRPQDGWEVFWHPALTDWLPDWTYRYATLDELYTLKVSHSGWELRNGSWEKHIEDAMTFKRAGAKLDMGLFKLLYGVWEDTHGRKRVDLTMESGDFFDDAVKRVYDHDSLHRSVAYGSRPMYEAVLKDGASVAVDMAKVKALSFDDKVKLYREEVFATALERIVVPRDYRCSPRAAYAWALRRTITSLTKGWSSRFLIENYDVFKRPDCDYVKRHRENADKLIPLEEK